MKLIVEAGSTKTDSILIGPGGQKGEIYQSPGINPVTDKDHLLSLQKLTRTYQDVDISHIFYYGSGCINPIINKKLGSNIKTAITSKPDVFVEDDLLAVGRGLCQHQAGIVGILGTGSNIGYYNGKLMVEYVRSCGYLIGDEGSGYALGQALFRRLARNQIDASTMIKIEKEFGITPDNCIEKLYQQSNPRQFLASFAAVITRLPAHLREEICNEVFDIFIDRMIEPMLKAHNASVGLSGSVAFHFQNELSDKLRKFDNIATSFCTSPLQGLIEYHTYE